VITRSRLLACVQILALAATFAALVWAAGEGQHLQCQRLTAAHNPAAATYCQGER